MLLDIRFGAPIRNSDTGREIKRCLCMRGAESLDETSGDDGMFAYAAETGRHEPQGSPQYRRGRTSPCAWGGPSLVSCKCKGITLRCQDGHWFQTAPLKCRASTASAASSACRASASSASAAAAPPLPPAAAAAAAARRSAWASWRRWKAAAVLPGG